MMLNADVIERAVVVGIAVPVTVAAGRGSGAIAPGRRGEGRGRRARRWSKRGWSNFLWGAEGSGRDFVAML